MFNERVRRCAAVQPCSLPIQVMTTGPLPTPSKCKSGLPRITGTCPGWWKQSFQLRLLSLVWFQVRATSCHFTFSKSAFQHQSVTGCAEECGDHLKQSGGRWQTLGVAAGVGAGQQVQRDPGLASGVLRLCAFLQRQPDRRHPPSIHRAPAGAYFKGQKQFYFKLFSLVYKFK